MTRVFRGVGLGALLYLAAGGRPRWIRAPARHEGPLLVATAVSAAIEELLWRGPLLRLLQSRLGSTPALAASATAFAASHLPAAAPQALVTHAGLAAVLGVAALREGGLPVAGAAHVTYDTFVLLEDRRR